MWCSSTGNTDVQEEGVDAGSRDASAEECRSEWSGRSSDRK